MLATSRSTLGSFSFRGGLSPTMSHNAIFLDRWRTGVWVTTRHSEHLTFSRRSSFAKQTWQKVCPHFRVSGRIGSASDQPYGTLQRAQEGGVDILKVEMIIIKQASKQTSKQASKQTSKQTSKQ